MFNDSDNNFSNNSYYDVDGGANFTWKCFAVEFNKLQSMEVNKFKYWVYIQ